MIAVDGRRMVESNGNVRFIKCQRWKELKQTVEYHAKNAARFKAPTMFRLLNNPGGIVGPQQFNVAIRNNTRIEIAEDLQNALMTLDAVSPAGCTPLSEHLEVCRTVVQRMKNDLVQKGQKVVVVIATDGLPSDECGTSGPDELKFFKDTLRSLGGLPIWVVIRLCTDNQKVVQFYNELDSELEYSLEVLDDFKGEAEEVFGHNPWLNYALPLHRIREMGFSHKLFDLLDERQLATDELTEFFILIFGSDLMAGVPDPHVEWSEFSRSISTIANGETSQWNPNKNKMMPWVDINELDSMYGHGYE